MTPGEQLKEHIASAIVRHCSLGMSNAINECDAIIDNLAIGRWVSVEERLPVVDSSGRWAGYTKDLGGIEAFGYYDYHNLCVFYSAWLDLSLPSGKGEA